MFIVYALLLLALTLWWWRRVDAWLLPLKHALAWRIIWGLWIAAMIFFPIAAGKLGMYFPAIFPSAGLLWIVLVLPLIVVSAGVGWLASIIARHIQSKPPPRPLDQPPANRAAVIATAVATGASIALSRRRFLTAAAAGAPILLTGGLTAASLWELGRFRVRDLSLDVDGWPAELNGFTIALVADIHTGPFTTPAMLADIVEKTNSIHNGGPADLVVLGGDLINTTLDDLPQALAVATALRGRLGTVAILGNHDVMDEPLSFMRRVERAGIPLLVDRNMTIEPAPGHRVELLGVDWRTNDDGLYQSVANVAARRNRSLFPICLAHHPHAWDEAVRQGLPLVLSGHTHGGQIMLTNNIGGGPLKFRYWSGVHRRDNSTLAISNGVGNWFPLRVNAPAELVKITLGRKIP